MPTPGQLFGLLTEFVLLLLGFLMILLAATKRFAFPERPTFWIALGVILIYWGARAWMRGAPSSFPRWYANLRGGSLALVGILMLWMTWIPFRLAGVFLGAAGGLLAVRGLISATLFARKP